MIEKKYIDLTDEEIDALPISHQRKWQLKNRERYKEQRRRWWQTEKGKTSKRAINKRYNEKRKRLSE